jgi:SecDF, P1 head subdomain
MPRVDDLLRDADPLRREAAMDERERDHIRHAVRAAAAETTAASRGWFRAPLAVVALAALILVGIFAAGARGPRGSGTLYAAVRFEVRLAETQPGAGLREVRVPGADRVIYLHDEVVITNDDIEHCAAVSGSGASRFDIGVEFNAAGAEKMRRATLDHEGRPMAILIDGEVVMAPVIRSPIGRSAVINGNYSKAEAERIVNGIGVR